MKIFKMLLAVFITLALILGLLGGAGYMGYRFVQDQKKKEEKIRYTQTDKGDLKVVLKETATLKPRKIVELKSKVSGRIIDLYYKAGATIEAGTVVADIDREEYERNLEVAEKDLERAQQAWDALLPDGEIVTQPEKIQARAMETLVDVVLIDYGAAKINYTNMKEMYARDLISLKALDDAEQAYDTAYVAYHQNVRMASKTLTEAKINFDQAIENLSETTIRTPVTGVITKVNVEAGELVQGTGNMSAGTVIAEVADLSEMMAVVKLNEVDVNRVRVGDTVSLTIDSKPGQKFAAEVERISPSGLLENNVVTFEVEIKIPEMQPFFRPEMTANADILVDQVDQVVRVPLEAVEDKKGKKKITLLKPKPEEAETHTGEAHAESVEGASEEEEEDREGDFYKTDFAKKILYEEEVVEIETGLTNELWAEVVSGVSEGVKVKLPELAKKEADFSFF
jgi:HlyD family secretion protein